MPRYRFLTYELLDGGAIARITLNRPGSRNAQNRGLLVELGDAMLAAEADDQVRVVILGGAGPMFSAGHDLGSRESRQEREPGPGQHASYRQYGGSRTGAERRMLQEWHFFFDNTRRWRNLRKITVAQVQDKIRALTPRTSQQDLEYMLTRLNQVMHGWANYFRHAVAKNTFAMLDNFAWWRVIRMLRDGTAGGGKTSAAGSPRPLDAGCRSRRARPNCGGSRPSR